ncbi:acyltransferase family protein [Pseudomonas sp. MLB6B]
MGFLRLLLACLVAVSHMGIDVKGWNVGVGSVVIFYMLAGHVVAKLWTRRPYDRLLPSLGWFYKDRALRIFPLYLCALLAGGLVWATGAHSYFLSKTPGFVDWMSNLTVVPLNYYMWTGIDRFTLIPPAWSLGAELQFYLILPLLMLLPWLGIFAAVGSLVVFSLAQYGWLNTDIFGYRLLLGVLFIFLSGVAIEKRSRLGNLALAGVWIALLAYVVGLQAQGIRRPFDHEVAVGYLVGLPLILWLSGLRLPGWVNTLQRHAGTLSYGVFVFHFSMIWLVEPYALSNGPKAGLVLLGSLLLAGVFHYGIERPVWQRFRTKLPARRGLHGY